MDTAVFFPDDDEGRNRALTVCQSCPTQGQCIVENLGDDQSGIFGCALSTRKRIRGILAHVALTDDEILRIARDANTNTLRRGSRPANASRRDHDWVRALREWFASTPGANYAAAGYLFGVSEDAARAVITGRTHRDAPGPITVPNNEQRERWAEERRQILAMAADGVPRRRIAEVVGVDIERVHRVIGAHRHRTLAAV